MPSPERTSEGREAVVGGREVKRRSLLAAAASVMGLLAGCSDADEAGSDEVLTPVPVPDDDGGSLAGGGVDGSDRLLDTHVDALSGRAFRVASEHAVEAPGAPGELTRTLSTADRNGGMTYRRYRQVPLGDGVEETFEGVWGRDGRAITRRFDGDNWTLVSDESGSVPPVSDRIDRERTGNALEAFELSVTEGPTATRLEGDRLTGAAPFSEPVSGPETGRLRAAIGSDGVIKRFEASVTGTDAGEPTSLSYELSVEPLGTDRVEGPETVLTEGWADALRDRSPLSGDG